MSALIHMSCVISRGCKLDQSRLSSISSSNVMCREKGLDDGGPIDLGGRDKEE